MSDDEIEFGDVQETEYRVRRRPDRDGHFAVASYGQPRDTDLPIFIDIEVLADIELHSQSDTSVELGGVLLGGQYRDEQGKPFVVVSDSIRAEAYESSRGHFKFTQETWTRISRRRDQFNDDLHMVGWYHTHPGWGVFLSSMDKFICENFFNRALDVAYVVDPVASDRGWFYWDRTASEPLPRSAGFFVTASRFRRPALARYLASLEGAPSMRPATPDDSQDKATIQQVIHVIRPQLGWLGVAVIGLLVAQSLLTLLLLLAFRVPAAPTTDASESLTIAQAELKAKQALFDQLLTQVPVDDDGKLNASKVIARNQALEQQLATLQRNELLLDELTERFRELQSESKNREQTLQKALAEKQALSARLAALDSKVSSTTSGSPTISSTDDAAAPAPDSSWEQVAKYVGLALFAVLIIGGLGWPWLSKRFRKPVVHPEEQEAR
jgi:proteasome lid subunit RPN8/RPN11